MGLNKIAVMGAGLMGTGIAQAVASGKYEVFVRDISADILNKSKAKIERQLKTSVEKGKISEAEARSVMGRIAFTEDLETAVRNADFVIEAIFEDLELKKKIFYEIDRIAKPSAILASNTSELSIASIGQSTSRKEKIIGTHWFFPPQVMKLVEVVVTPTTSEETLEATISFCRKIGKETVVCKDAPGFITSRAISALCAECLRIHEEGIASIEEIDKAMRLGFNHPMGPFQTIDMSGVDVVYHVLENLTKVYGDRFKPNKTISKLVDSGYLGKKTGKGFYNYNTNEIK